MYTYRYIWYIQWEWMSEWTFICVAYVRKYKYCIPFTPIVFKWLGTKKSVYREITLCECKCVMLLKRKINVHRLFLKCMFYIIYVWAAFYVELLNFSYLLMAPQNLLLNISGNWNYYWFKLSSYDGNIYKKKFFICQLLIEFNSYIYSTIHVSSIVRLHLLL